MVRVNVLHQPLKCISHSLLWRAKRLMKCLHGLSIFLKDPIRCDMLMLNEYWKALTSRESECSP